MRSELTNATGNSLPTKRDLKPMHVSSFIIAILLHHHCPHHSHRWRVLGCLVHPHGPKDPTAWAEWLIETSRAIRGAMVSYRDGGRVVAGASFRAKTLAKLAILTTRVLNEAGFDLLHASLATGTTLDYVWGFVIEEQAGEGPEPEPEAPQGQEAASPYRLGLMDANFMAVIMTERNNLATTEKFEWGLRVIVSDLKSTSTNTTNDIKTWS